MNTKTSAIVFAIVMVFSSFVGCIDTEEEKTESVTSPSSLGNVMVSTYHVAELARAVGGDRISVEIISPSNVPVHDYEPSASDLIRLQEVDLFFYHGLNLEPWVDSAISSLGSDAPLAVQTHAMPSGENTLDYQTMLLSNICEALNDDAYEAVTLADHHDEAGDVEIHAEAMTHKVSYPEMDDDHDDHGDDHDDHGDDHDDHGDDHDDHGDDHDDHGDDHDAHAEHNHAMAEKVISNPANCPTDTVVSVFHLEEGEYLLEFEYGAATEFDMVVLKMMGGHAHHHHHGHGSGPYEWAGIFSISDSAHTWTMEKKDGSYADPSMKVVIIPTDTPTEATMHSLEEDAESLIEGDSCVDVQDGGTMTPIAPEGSCFNLVVGTGDMSSFNMDTTGMTGFAAFTAHSPYEFENTQHYLKDSAGNDVEHVAEEGGGHDDHGHDDHGDGDEHDDHDDHGDEHDDHDDHGDDHHDHGDDHHEEMTELMAIFNSSDADGDGFLNLTELEYFIPAVMEFDDHDDHGDDDHDDHGDDDHDDHGDDDHDDHGDDDHDDNETHDDHGDNETHHDDEFENVLTPEEVLMMFDTNNDSLLSFDEFWHSWEEDYEPESYCYDMVSDEIMDHIIEEECVGDDLMWVEVTINDHDDHHVAFATLHVEEEGDYGFALPSGIEYFILMGEGGHDDHDDHDDHGHDDHSDDEDHSDEENSSDDGGEIVADEDEEAFDYDPHSWLSPVAYKAQIDVVLNALTTAFPEGEADFKANAEAYSAKLDTLDANYTAAFGVGGTCEVSNTEKTIVANHNAYAYISERYDIEILTVHGLDPEGEPSAADIAEVVEQIEEKNLTVLYVEEYTSTSSVDTIVEQTGVTIKILYTMELPPKDSEDTYLTLMDKNLNSLVEGMGC